MKILTIDSATDTYCVSVCENEKLTAEIFAARPKAQLKCLAQSISNAIKTAEIKKSEVELVAVAAGPGSFTGIRLAISTAAACAQVLDIPAAPLNTIDCVCAGLPQSNKISAIVFDARREEIFTAIYKNGERISEYMALSAENFIEKAIEHKVSCVAGNAIAKYGEILTARLPETELLPPYFWYPHGAPMAALAAKMHREGKTVRYDNIQPVYMRRPEAEETREKRLKAERCNAVKAVGEAR